MLQIEKQICKRPHHRDCRWVRVPTSYPDARLNYLFQYLKKQCVKNQQAYRILHNKKVILSTLKYNDGKPVYIQRDAGTIRNTLLLKRKIAIENELMVLD